MKAGKIAVLCLSVAWVGLPDPGQAQSPAPGPSSPTPIAESFTNSLGMEFVPVEGLDGVLFSRYETRVKDFRAFVEDKTFNGGYSYRAGHAPYVFKGGELVNNWDYGWSNPGFEQPSDHSVTCVGWEDAKAFCEWLTRKERQEQKIGLDQEYRLPTDWEWSMAVGLRESREGSPESKSEKIKDIYPWKKGRGTWPPPKGAGNYAGEELTEVWPNFIPNIEGYNDGYSRTSPVGSFAANANGIYDLGGNIWEWCEDFYDGRSSSRVLRGGSWIIDSLGSLLSSSRHLGHPAGRSDIVGFRVVLAGSPK